MGFWRYPRLSGTWLQDLRVTSYRSMRRREQSAMHLRVDPLKLLSSGSLLICVESRVRADEVGEESHNLWVLNPTLLGRSLR